MSFFRAIRPPGSSWTPWPSSPISSRNVGPDVKKIVAGWYEAVKFAAENPKEADAIMAKFTGQKPEEFTKEKTGVRFYGVKENKDYFGTPQKPGLLYTGDPAGRRPLV